ncbi:hypothetical protein FIBSPDRAFT_891153 [Athelia psychrophila]|uniref:Uncharacterized protein n=1 Tax=Athelia psychrophila TaxID=1759441 RepID=A0A166K2B0_9AGAM|nr:hypothetical protein FIBSPDRAFT_891153 [Fibularhizoctonia sp. CBS 109695]
MPQRPSRDSACCHRASRPDAPPGHLLCNSLGAGRAQPTSARARDGTPVERRMPARATMTRTSTQDRGRRRMRAGYANECTSHQCKSTAPDAETQNGVQVSLLEQGLRRERGNTQWETWPSHRGEVSPQLPADLLNAAGNRTEVNRARARVTAACNLSSATGTPIVDGQDTRGGVVHSPDSEVDDAHPDHAPTRTNTITKDGQKRRLRRRRLTLRAALCVSILRGTCAQRLAELPSPEKRRRSQVAGEYAANEIRARTGLPRTRSKLLSSFEP